MSKSESKSVAVKRDINAILEVEMDNIVSSDKTIEKAQKKGDGAVCNIADELIRLGFVSSQLTGRNTSKTVITLPDGTELIQGEIIGMIQVEYCRRYSKAALDAYITPKGEWTMQQKVLMCGPYVEKRDRHEGGVQTLYGNMMKRIRKDMDEKQGKNSDNGGTSKTPTQKLTDYLHSALSLVRKNEGDSLSGLDLTSIAKHIIIAGQLIDDEFGRDKSED